MFNRDGIPSRIGESMDRWMDVCEERSMHRTTHGIPASAEVDASATGNSYMRSPNASGRPFLPDPDGQKPLNERLAKAIKKLVELLTTEEPGQNLTLGVLVTLLISTTGGPVEAIGMAEMVKLTINKLSELDSRVGPEKTGQPVYI